MRTNGEVITYAFILADYALTQMVIMTIHTSCINLRYYHTYCHTISRARHVSSQSNATLFSFKRIGNLKICDKLFW